MAVKRLSVRRLFVRDPYNKNSTLAPPWGNQPTVATFSPVADQFTNNPNPVFDPSKGSNSMKEVSVASTRKAANKPGRAARGHMKAIKPNRITLFGGKRLKRF